MSGTPKNLGIIPLAINYIFYSIENTPGRQFLLRVSYMEIYNEKVNDLLEIKNKNLKLHEDSHGQVVVDVEERVCKSSQEVLEEKYKGDKNRRIGVTNMNERSSRSHTIFRIILESRIIDDEDGAVKVSHVNLVDLAGSERAGQSGATGDRFKEGCHINSSLTTLGLVINQLSDGQEGQFISFRDSKLTRLLQSSLGGNAVTVIICAVTPTVEDQTQNTLNFALRAKKIKVTPILNEVLSDAALIKRYQKQIAKLCQELEDMKSKSTTADFQEMEFKLKEKEQLNEQLFVRINRLKEVLLVSSCSPLQMNKSKSRGRSRRRMTWSGQQDRRSMLFNSPTLGTIAEDTLLLNPPQANSTRLDEIVCPFEKFELELIRRKDESWNDDGDELFEDARENVTTSNSTKLSKVTMTVENDNCTNMNMTITNKNINLLVTNPETPPVVLRERISSISNTLNSVMQEYGELKEFTDLEKQLGIGDCGAESDEQVNLVALMKENGSLKQRNRSLETALKETTAAYESLKEQHNKVTVVLEEINKSKLVVDENLDVGNELKELKERNEFLQHEVQLKDESYNELQQQINDLNKTIASLTQDKLVIEDKCTILEKKFKAMEKSNLDLEVTLDMKRKTSLERESELERELQNAWSALEKRGQLITPSNSLIRCSVDQLNESALNSISTPAKNIINDIEESVNTDINFVTCDMSLISDQTINNMLVADPLKSFSLNQSMLPINIPCTPKYNGSNDIGSDDKNDLLKELITLKSENENLQKQLDNLKLEYEADNIKRNRHIDELESHVSNVDSLLIDLYTITDCQQEKDSSYQELKEYIGELKGLQQSVNDLQTEKETLTTKLEERVEYSTILMNLKNLLGVDDETFNYDQLSAEIIAMKCNVHLAEQKLLDVEKQHESTLDYYKNELNVSNVSLKKNSKMSEELIALLKEFRVNVDESQITDTIKEIIKKNHDLNEQVSVVNNRLQGEVDYENKLKEITLECVKYKSLWDNLIKILKTDLSDSINEDNIEKEVRDIILLCKDNSTEIIKLNAEITQMKSSEILLEEVINNLRTVFEDASASNITNITSSLIDIKTQFDKIGMQSYTENEVFIKNLILLLKENGFAVGKEGLVEAVSTLITDSNTLKEELNNIREIKCESQKEYMQQVKNMKLQLDETDDLLQKMCTALKDRLETNVNKADLLDTVLSLIQYKEKYTRMSVSYEEQKGLSDTINNLQNILKEDINGEEKDKLVDIVANLKKNNKNLKQQLQDEKNVTIATESEWKTEISTIKEELEAKRMYEAAVKDVYSILKDKFNEVDEKCDVQKVKNAVVLLKESNAELKTKLDNLQTINTESETLYKCEVDMLKSELETGKIYEMVMNDLLIVLQDESNSESGSSQFDVKTAVVALKEQTLTMKRTIKELQNEMHIKDGDIERLKGKIEKNGVFESCHLELCSLLGDSSGAPIEKCEIIDVVKKLKTTNEELKRNLEQVQNEYTNYEMMVLEIDIIKTEIESLKEFKEINEELCHLVGKHFERNISKDDLKQSLVTMIDELLDLRNQINDFEDTINHLKLHATVLKEILVVLSESESADINNIKGLVSALKEENTNSRVQLEDVQFSLAEAESLYRNEILNLKSELESANVCKTVVNELLNILTEENENSVAIDAVKTNVVHLKESNRNLKQLLESSNKTSNETESQLLDEIEKLKADVYCKSVYETIVNKLIIVLQYGEDLEIEKLVNCVKLLKDKNMELHKEVQRHNDEELNMKVIKEENEQNMLYKSVITDICDILQIDVTQGFESSITDAFKEMKEEIALLKDEVKCGETKYEKTIKYLFSEIKKLHANIQSYGVSDTILNNSLIDEADDEIINLGIKDFEDTLHILKGGIQELKIRIDTMVKEKETELAFYAAKMKENESVIADLQINSSEFMQYRTTVDDLCTLLQSETQRIISQNELKNVIIELNENIATVRGQIVELKNSYEEKESNYESTIQSLQNTLDEENKNTKLLFTEFANILQNVNYSCFTGEELINMGIAIKDCITELKKKVTDLQNVNNELQQRKLNSSDVSNLVESYEPYETLVNDLCVMLNVNMLSDNKIELLKNILMDVNNERTEYKVQLDSFKCLVHDQEKKSEGVIQSLETELLSYQEYKLILDEIRSIVDDGTDVSYECSSLKNNVFSLKEENSALKRKLEVNSDSKGQIDCLKEKLESYVECVDICYNLCSLLSAEGNVKVHKHEIKDVIIGLKKENEDLRNQLQNTSSSFSDNSKQLKEVEGVEDKVKELSEYETLVGSICRALLETEGTFSSKEQIFQCIIDLRETNTSLNKALEEQESERETVNAQFKVEISKLQEFKDIVNNLSDYFSTDCNKKKEEVRSYISQLKSNVSVVLMEIINLKDEYENFQCNSQQEIEELRGEIQTQSNYCKIVKDLMVIMECNDDSSSLIASINSLKINSERLENEINDIKFINDQVTNEKVEHGVLFGNLKTELELECTIKEYETILNAIRNLKNSYNQLEEQLREQSNSLESVRKQNEDGLSKLQEYDDVFSVLREILDLKHEVMPKGIITEIDKLKKDNTGLKQIVVDMENANENIIAKLDVANDNLKIKLHISNENENLLSELIKFCGENFKPITMKEEILEVFNFIKSEQSNTDNKLTTLISENEAMKSEMEMYKFNEDAIIKMIKTLSIDFNSDLVRITTEVVDKLKEHCDNLERKVCASLGDSLITQFMNEIKNLLSHIKSIFPINDDENNFSDELSAKEQMNCLLRGIKVINDHIKSQQVKDFNIRLKLIDEMKNLNPSFDDKCEKYSATTLVNKFISLVMEKESEIILTIKQTTEADIAKLVKKVAQLKSEEEKMQSWNQQLESDTADLKQDLVSKCEEIKSLNIKAKRLQDEVEQKSNELTIETEKVESNERDLVEMQWKNSDNVKNLENQCKELRNDIDRKNIDLTVANQNLKEKESEISKLQKLIDSTESSNRKLCHELDTIKSYVADHNGKITELEECKLLYEDNISELKIKLDEKSTEHSQIKGMLNMVKEECNTLKQSLTTSIELKQSNLNEVANDLEKTRETLKTLRDSMKVEQSNYQKEKLFLMAALKEKDAVCKKFESELFELKNNYEILLEKRKMVTTLENELAMKNKELLEEKQINNNHIKEIEKNQTVIKMKENFCNEFEKNIADLAQENTSLRKAITKLENELTCKEEDFNNLEKRYKEHLKSTEIMEGDLRLERQHTKKLRLKNESLLRKLEKLEEKENVPSNTFSPTNTPAKADSSIYQEKVGNFEKELFSILEPKPKSLDNALQVIKGIIEKVKDLERQLSDAELNKNELDEECELMNDRIKELDKENNNYSTEKYKLEMYVKSLQTELENDKTVIENLKKVNAQLNVNAATTGDECERLKQSIKEVRGFKKPIASLSEKKQADSQFKDMDNSTEFKTLVHNWEQRSKTPVNQECKCEELLVALKELKLELTDKNGQIAMLEIQIQGENFPYKKKSHILEEELNEAKTKIMALKQEIRRLRSCLHEVTVFQGHQSGPSLQTPKKNLTDAATQVSLIGVYLDDSHDCSTSSSVPKQSTKFLQDKISKMERESVLLKRLCRDRNKRIEGLELKLKGLGFTGMSE